MGVVILFAVCDGDRSFAQRRKAAIYMLFKISKARLKTDKTKDYPALKDDMLFSVALIMQMSTY